jgi:hypothetical protein
MEDGWNLSTRHNNTHLSTYSRCTVRHIR